MLRRVTFAFPEDELRRAREYARSRGRSVNEYIRCFVRLYGDPVACRGRTFSDLVRMASDAAERGEGKLPRRGRK